MADKATVSMGFRLAETDYKVVKGIAETQRRSIANILQMMVTSSLHRFEAEGWKSITYGQEDVDG